MFQDVQSKSANLVVPLVPQGMLTPAKHHLQFQSYLFGKTCTLPYIIKRGWLENTLSKWRFIAEKVIHKWGMFNIKPYYINPIKSY